MTLSKLLNTPITLPAGEIIGVSREVSQLLHEAIKPKPQVSKQSMPSMLASSFSTKTRGMLIRLAVDCDGRQMQAILDTGSMLNICSQQTWKKNISRPMDITQSLSMNDANGGEGTLKGLVRQVPLNIGNIQTLANLYVGEHVPFDLLLGRPWQRGNFVSIDERQDGTYLVFKDPQTLAARYEVLVTPDGVPLEYQWNFDPSTWYSSIPAIQDLDWEPESGDDVKSTLELYSCHGSQVFTTSIPSNSHLDSDPDNITDTMSMNNDISSGCSSPTSSQMDTDGTDLTSELSQVPTEIITPPPEDQQMDLIYDEPDPALELWQEVQNHFTLDLLNQVSDQLQNLVQAEEPVPDLESASNTSITMPSSQESTSESELAVTQDHTLIGAPLKASTCENRTLETAIPES